MSELIKRIHYIDPTFNPATAFDVDCVVTLDNFCTYIALKKENKLIALQVFDHKTKNINAFTEDDFKHFELLSNSYKNITVLCASQKDTLIPTTDFDKFNIEDYIKFNFQTIDNEVVLYDDLVDLEITNVYTINQSLLKTLNNLWPGFIIRNQKSDLLTHFFKHNGQAQNVYVNTRQDCFDCIVFNEKGLLFSNSFYYNSAQDYIYYLMNVVKQLGLNPEELNLFLSGEIEKEGAIFNFIYRYIRNINFIQKPETTEWLLEEVPYHYLFNLL